MTPDPIHNPELHLMEERDLLVDEESVGHPDELDVLRPHHQLLQVLRPLERQPRVSPELAGGRIKIGQTEFELQNKKHYGNC